MKTKAVWMMVGPFLAALSGCGSDFDPPSYLSDLRVLAIVADPVEAGPQDEVRITPAVFVHPSTAISEQRLSFCPFSLGSSAGFRCAVAECETPLSLEGDGSATVRPYELLLACAARLGGGAGGDIPQEIPESLEVVYRLEVKTENGDARLAVLRQRLWTRAAPPALNRNPVIQSVMIGGTEVLPGGTAAAVPLGGEIEVSVRTDPESLDSFVDPSGRERKEDAVVAFFATAGRFDFDQGYGTDIAVNWKADEAAPPGGRAEMYFVLRDLRGGQAVSGPYFVPIGS
ncbi:MAG: hypothetical protein GYA21_08775 [Myxococcales bacterium]|nr:hypothetical protein [Myxococcales bacterium]